MINIQVFGALSAIYTTHGRIARTCACRLWYYKPIAPRSNLRTGLERAYAVLAQPHHNPSHSKGLEL